ncbi:hypothetical protein BH20ACT5_BH20ACT5_07510 [soil metagenome]
MRSLQECLELQDESGLTGVCVMPFARQVADGTGQVVLQIAVGLSEASDVAASAVSRFLAGTVATINGNQPDGSEWFATFQYVDSSADGAWLCDASSAMLDRALSLTGVDVDAVRGHALGWSDLHGVYDLHGIDGIADWSSFDLLLGLIINLTRGDLGRLVAEVDDLTMATAGRAMRRRQQFHALLYEWAAFYKGPEPLAG